MKSICASWLIPFFRKCSLCPFPILCHLELLLLIYTYHLKHFVVALEKGPVCAHTVPQQVQSLHFFGHWPLQISPQTRRRCAREKACLLLKMDTFMVLVHTVLPRVQPLPFSDPLPLSAGSPPPLAYNYLNH